MIENRWIPALLFIYPVLLLVVQGGMNGAFFLSIIVSVYYLLGIRGRIAWDKDAKILTWVMASPVLAILISHLYHQNFHLYVYDGPLRFLIAVPVYLMLRGVAVDRLTIVQYSFPLGAILAAVMISFFPHDWGGRLGSSFVNPIHFGDLALILAALSFCSLNWAGKDRPALLALKVIGVFCGLYASVQTGSRGGWLAIPFLVLIWAFFKHKEISRLGLAAAFSVLVLGSVGGYYLSDTVHNRIDHLFHAFTAYDQGNLDTSSGERIQMWGAAWKVFTENPLFGVGPDEFRNQVDALGKSGLLTPEAMVMAKAELHNEILSKSANLGLFGLVSILSIFLFPLWLFIKAARSAPPLAKGAALQGIFLLAGFFIFGLSAEIFSLKMTVSFFAMTLAVLLAAATNRHGRTETRERAVK